MTTQDMTLDRLETILAAYGAAPAHWPEDEREAAEALIARSDRARAALAAAAHVDRLLDTAPPPPADDALAARLREMTPERNATVVPFAARRRPTPWHSSGLARAAVVVLALVGGVAIGIALPDNAAVSPAAPEADVAGGDFAAPEPSLASFDFGDTGETGDVTNGAPAETASGTPVLASFMNSGEPGFTTVSYVDDSSDSEGLALAALPLQ